MDNKKKRRQKPARHNRLRRTHEKIRRRQTKLETRKIRDKERNPKTAVKKTITIGSILETFKYHQLVYY